MTAPARIGPHLGAFDTAMVVVSLVIGIGIFRTPAMVAAPAPDATSVLAMWIAGGLVSLMGALTFAEIGARLPRAGGYYRVIADCYDSRLAFMLTWGQALMQGAGAAGVAFLGAEYLAGALGPAEPWRVSAIAFTTMIGLCALNFLGIRAGARAQNILSLAKLALILAIVAGALLAAPAPAAPPAAVPWTGLATGIVAVLYAYGGYANSINLGADVRDPIKNLPRAIVGGMLIVTAVYVLANWAYLHVLGAHGVAASGLVAAATARAAFGPWGEIFVSVAIYTSAAGFLNAAILQMPRGYYAMAEDGVLPASFLRVDPRTSVLRTGLFFFAATMLLPALAIGSFEGLLNYVMFTDTLSLAVVASTVFVLRRRAPDERVFKIPGYPVTPALYIAAVLALAGWLFYTRTALALAGLAMLAVGAILFSVARRSHADRH